jgi:hypothetical protein
LKIRYVGEGEDVKLSAEDTYIGGFFAGMIHNTPDCIGEYLIENYPYLFEKVEEEQNEEI